MYMYVSQIDTTQIDLSVNGPLMVRAFYLRSGRCEFKSRIEQSLELKLKFKCMCSVQSSPNFDFPHLQLTSTLNQTNKTQIHSFQIEI